MPQVIVPAAGQYGFIPDQPTQELPVNAWSDVENIRFRNGCAERVEGHAPIFSTPSVVPYHLAPYQTNAKKYIVHCGLAAVFADDGTTRSNITGTAPTGTATDFWTDAVLGGVLLLNNGVDVPTFWAGTGTLASLPGWNAAWRCKSLAAFKNFAVAVGITKSGAHYPHMVKWSDAADPGAAPASWDEADATKLAGEQEIAETPDLIVDQLVLGDALLIYKERSVYAMRFIGGTQVFEFRRVPGNYGMLARGCAAVTPMGHCVLANGDVVLVDGVNEPKSILSERAKRWLFSSQIDSANYVKSFVVSNPSRAEVWICYPEVGETNCTRALVWNWESNTFGVRELPNVTHACAGLVDYSAANSWNTDTDVWANDSSLWNQDEFTPADPRLVLASTQPNLFLADAGNSFNGVGVEARLERAGMAFDAPEQVKLIRSVIPRIDAPAGTVLQISVGGAMDAETLPIWGQPVTYTVGSSYKADAFAVGRFLALRIQSTSGAKWRMKSFSLDVIPQGAY